MFSLQIDKFTLDRDNDLFYGLKVAGSSLGIVTEFLYKIYEQAGGTFLIKSNSVLKLPNAESKICIEPDPIFIPVSVRGPEDLLKFRRLRQEKKYEVALNRAYVLRAIRPSVQTRVREEGG